MRKVISLIVVLSLTTITLTGCWDRVEIEEIGFVLGVGIDLQKKEDVEERAERAAPGKPEGKRRYLLTQQIAIPGGLQGGQGSGAGGADQKAYYNIVSEGDTMFEMVRSVAARTSRTPYYEHIKIIIISKEIADIMGMTISSVKSLLFRARSNISGKLEEYISEPLREEAEG